MNRSVPMNKAEDISRTWLEDFAQLLTKTENVEEGVTKTFLPDGWLRDLLIFTWDNRSLNGLRKIACYLQENLPRSVISNIELDHHSELAPKYLPLNDTLKCVCSGFKFSTTVANGHGFFRLVEEGPGCWKAATVFIMADSLKGHEELGYELGVYGGHTLSWTDVQAERRKSVEVDPYVLIIGGGQTGLNIGARFRQMKIPALIIEQNNRIGDNWRKRYPTLTLHTPRSYSPMLYQPFPKNWPLYSPRDKIADWLEQYASSQDLTAWTNARAEPIPVYDSKAKRWSVTIIHDGTSIELHPVHIVVATGMLGIPRVPSPTDQNIFKGVVFHASKYEGGKLFSGKRAIIVGAGNTSADICQDLVFHGASSVTMIQRSSTCIVASSTTRDDLLRGWPEGGSVDIADLKAAAIPFLYLKKVLTEHAEEAIAKEKELHDMLRKGGLNVSFGTGGSGCFPLVFEKAGNYWLDVGCAELIGSGRVKVKHGVEIAKFIEDSVIFTDGTSLKADLVVFATGYHTMHDGLKTLFGAEIMDQTGPIWGVDEEGEARGCYRPSGHPGLWFGAGDFYYSRFYSKQLALIIKAIQIGLV
ncbi:dimethylaniline monooxygenase [Crucibulum laeve]|uniref:Dimethylaniline monooxygenase n=1 Tax=Crucibulum laeve TaxID=68775 RepID=A0A5C3MDF1_9AGAR|nr:dimethylaniline monooxygenase [Crucibulum laeve]